MAATAPTPADRSEPTAAATCIATVDGHVVDAATHEPIAGAVIQVDGQAAAMTEANGRFSLGGLCPGVRVIEVERIGYDLRREELAIAESRDATALSLELELSASGEVIVMEGEAPTIDMRSTAVLSGDALQRTRGESLSAAIAEVPGVSELRSGSGMAKPIVRGQFGRRLLMLVDGIRHRSQDWGIDHVPEIDPFIADRITVVRGAAGVQYGPDAIGGAILVDPPRLRFEPGYEGQLHLFGSYGPGAGAAARVQAATAELPGLGFQLEGSFKRLAAPMTPNYPLDNTGALEWNTGAAIGYRAGDSKYQLSYRHYGAELGVCRCLRIESSEDFFAQLARERPIDADSYRSSFAIDRPYQAVAHDLAIARGHWPLPGVGALTATYALQYDHRREYEIVRSASGPQLDFRLTTHDLDVKVEHVPVHLNNHVHLDGAAGLLVMAQNHRYSGFSLVPDHQAWSGGVYALERLIGHDFELEAGLRYDATARSASLDRRDFLRLVRSDQLAADACGTGESDPVGCDSTFHTISASVGGLLQLTAPWAIKLDLSTASRPPNPDEQYLNGTAPSFPVLGLGKPDLGPETTYSASLTTTFNGNRVAGEASVYSNFISDYIQFAPAVDANGEPIFDVLIRGTFPRFITRSVDAVFYGADGGVTINLLPSLDAAGQVSLDAAGQVSLVRARNVSDDSFLAFIPPDRARGSLTYRRGPFLGLHGGSAMVAGTYVARQDRYEPTADLAPPPDSYFLLDAEVGAEAMLGGHEVELAVAGSNLLNTRYRDYTSLLRYFADQPGWQLMVRLSAHFSSEN